MVYFFVLLFFVLFLFFFFFFLMIRRPPRSTPLYSSAASDCIRDSNYSQVTARLLMDKIRAEALQYLGVGERASQQEMEDLYAKALSAYIEKGIEYELLSPELAEFDLNKLGAAIDGKRDLQFSYLGLQTLYDRYFIHHNDTRIELPQCFFMRVAMGLAVEEDNREARAIEFYNRSPASTT